MAAVTLNMNSLTLFIVVLDTHEKPFSCTCGALFTRKDLLRRHERIVHNPFEDDVGPWRVEDHQGLPLCPPDQPVLEVEQTRGETGALPIPDEDAHWPRGADSDRRVPSLLINTDSPIQPSGQSSRDCTNTPGVSSTSQGTLGNCTIKDLLPTIFPMPFMPLGKFLTQACLRIEDIVLIWQCRWTDSSLLSTSKYH